MDKSGCNVKTVALISLLKPCPVISKRAVSLSKRNSARTTIIQTGCQVIYTILKAKHLHMFLLIVDREGFAKYFIFHTFDSAMFLLLRDLRLLVLWTVI